MRTTTELHFIENGQRVVYPAGTPVEMCRFDSLDPEVEYCTRRAKRMNQDQETEDFVPAMLAGKARILNRNTIGD
jgi:hypothetical protein